MKKDRDGNSGDSKELYREAERRLEGAIDDTLGVSLDEEVPLKKLLHELKVHQAELEIQNEELRETRSRLHRSREKYSDLYEFAPVSYLTLNEKGRILKANLTAAEELGVERDDLLGKNFYKYVVEEDRDDLYKHLRQVFKTKERQTEELRIALSPDTTEPEKEPNDERAQIYFLLKSKAFKDRGGDIACRTILSDITERKELEQKLRESERKYRSLFNSIRDAILVADTDRNIINCNPAFTDLFGYELEEIKGKKTGSLYRDEDEYKEMGQEIQESLGDPNFFYTVHYEKKNGEVFPGETNVFYLNDDGGEVIGFIGLIRNVTKRLERQRKLKQSEKRYRTVFENTGTAMLILDEDTAISLANEKVEELTGYTKDEIEGNMSWTELVAREEKLGEMKQYHDSRREDPDSAPNQYEFKLLDKDRKEKDVLITIDVIPGTKKSVASLIDITDRKSHEHQMRRSFVELAETTSRVLGVRDPYTQKHELRVGELARAVGERRGLSEEKLLGLYIGGVLHDIGKIVVPETILTKPGELKDVEWRMIKSHPKVGYNQILEDTDFPWPVAEMTLHHHERLDGSGYPDGLTGEELTTEVRILGAVDVVEAMSTRRPYRAARSKERTLNVLQDGKKEKFDPEVVDILVKMIEEGKIEFGGDNVS